MSAYRAAIEAAAATHGLDPDLVQALVEQESTYRFYAYRFEPGFYDRYLKGRDDYAAWTPQECAASYGLCQVMFSTAREHGFTGQPWELFSPTVSLEFGCRVLAGNLAWARRTYNGPTVGAENKILRSALAAYNGGRVGNAPDNVVDRNASYADEVMARYLRIRRGA